jgi:hypothetical protein
MANKLILDNDTMTKLKEAEQGSSPVLHEQREVKLTTTSHVDKNVISSHHLRRSISMLETRTSDKYFSAKLSPEHPKPVSDNDFTSPVSRVTFKRPAIPCSSSDDVDENQTSKRRKTFDSRCQFHQHLTRNFYGCFSKQFGFVITVQKRLVKCW